MNSASLSTPLTIDTLLRDTFVSVLQLRAGTSAKDGLNLYKSAKNQIETVQSTLRAAQYSDAVISDITYAQCAILDEAVMNRHLLDTDDKAYQTWVGIPLQIHFFNTLEAGEALYERIQLALSQSSPNPLVIACFHRVLLLGFSGKYGENRSHPEREAIFERLEMLVKQLGQFPLQSHQKVFLGVRKKYIWQIPTRKKWWLGLTLLALLVYGLWWIFDYQLKTQLSRVIPTKSMIDQQLNTVKIKDIEVTVIPSAIITNLNSSINDKKEKMTIDAFDSGTSNQTGLDIIQPQSILSQQAPKTQAIQSPSSMNSTPITVIKNEAPATVVEPTNTEVDRD